MQTEKNQMLLFAPPRCVGSGSRRRKICTAKDLGHFFSLYGRTSKEEKKRREKKERDVRQAGASSTPGSQNFLGDARRVATGRLRSREAREKKKLSNRTAESDLGPRANLPRLEPPNTAPQAKKFLINALGPRVPPYNYFFRERLLRCETCND